MKLEECETVSDLVEWVGETIPSARVSFLGDEIVIMTGLEMSMGGYLHKIGEVEEEGDI